MFRFGNDIMMIPRNVIAWFHSVSSTVASVNARMSAPHRGDTDRDHADAGAGEEHDLHFQFLQA